MNKKIIMNPNIILDIYTDGSFQKNKPIWGFVAYKDGELIYKNKGVIEVISWAEGRQISSECWAVVEALKWCKANDYKAKIFFDFVGLRSWLGDLWGEKPWRANKEYTILYRKLVLEHKNYLVDMVKVKGHSGVVGNEMVDGFLKN